MSFDPIDGRDMDRYVVFGHVVGVHIDDRFIKNGRARHRRDAADRALRL